MEKLAATDPRYKDAARIADEVLMGAVADPTEGATHFLNPVIVRQRRGGTLQLGRAEKANPSAGTYSMRQIATLRDSSNPTLGSVSPPRYITRPLKLPMLVEENLAESVSTLFRLLVA